VRGQESSFKFNVDSAAGNDDSVPLAQADTMALGTAVHVAMQLVVAPTKQSTGCQRHSAESNQSPMLVLEEQSGVRAKEKRNRTSHECPRNKKRTRGDSDA
jgi:hypothetical protein